MQEQNGKNGQSETQHLADAIAIANVPTLLMVLVQMTGDLHWLEDRYRTRRARGIYAGSRGAAV